MSEARVSHRAAASLLSAWPRHPPGTAWPQPLPLPAAAGPAVLLPRPRAAALQGAAVDRCRPVHLWAVQRGGPPHCLACVCAASSCDSGTFTRMVRHAAPLSCLPCMHRHRALVPSGCVITGACTPSGRLRLPTAALPCSASHDVKPRLSAQSIQPRHTSGASRLRPSPGTLAASSCSAGPVLRPRHGLEPG